MAKRKTETDVSTAESPSRGVAIDWSRKVIFTTGEAAEVCKVSQQTIIRSFDAGRLTGFKVPGSKFRRIPREELVRFMRENAMPLDAITPPTQRILAVCAPESAAEIRAGAEGFAGVEVHTSDNPYEAGVLTERLRPACVVLDARLLGRGIATACAVAKAGEVAAVLICNGEPVVGADGVMTSLNAGEVERWLKIVLGRSAEHASNMGGSRDGAGGSN